MVKLTDLRERADGRSPHSTSADFRRATDVIEYEFNPASIQDLVDIQTLVLGQTSYNPSLTPDSSGASGDGRLHRALPLSHPIYPYRYASNLQLKGAGVPTKVPSSTARQLTLQAPYVSQVSLYPEYDVHVEFTQRLYNVLSDNAITWFGQSSPVGRGQWYDLGGTLHSGATGFDYANEWLRYTDYELDPREDWITYQIGAGMLFKTGVGAPKPNNKTYAAMPRIRLPNQLLKVTWYQIPYRYITSANSYLQKWVGYINQNDWWNWKAGQLLYMNYKPIRYQHPKPPVTAVGAAGAVGPGKHCDVELYFLLTNRTTTDPLPTASNLNSVVAGHNLLPWAGDRRFHYAETKDADPQTGFFNAFWQSFPVEILFWDPDVPHQAGL